MFHRSFSKFLTGCLLAALVANAWAVVHARGDTLEKIKSDVTKRTGEKVVVSIKNGPKMKGVVSNVLDESFDLLDVKTRQAATIPYRDVEKVKKQGWSTGAKVALGVAIGATVVTAVVLGALANDPLGSFCPLGC
jgi:hypothetical protein